MEKIVFRNRSWFYCARHYLHPPIYPLGAYHCVYCVYKNHVPTAQSTLEQKRCAPKIDINNILSFNITSLQGIRLAYTLQMKTTRKFKKKNNNIIYLELNTKTD